MLKCPLFKEMLGSFNEAMETRNCIFDLAPDSELETRILSDQDWQIFDSLFALLQQ